MKFFVVLLIFLNANGAKAATATTTATNAASSDKPWYTMSVTTQTHYIYNVFYNYDNVVGDMSFLITPNFKAQTKPRFFTFEVDLTGGYEKFLSQTIQDHLDYSFMEKIFINEGGHHSGTFVTHQSQFSDPSSDSTYGRILHNKVDGTLEYVLKAEGGNQIKLNAQVNHEDIRVPGYTYNPSYLSHYDFDAFGEYDFKFLPETFWFLRGSGGFREYISPDLDPNGLRAKYVYGAYDEKSIKTRSGYFLGEIGLVGRLTEKTSVDCATGILTRIYPFWDSFQAPVFYLHFIEQVTRRDQLIAGYDYVVEDAYSTNYMLNQEIYIGLARMMGDQLLLLTKLTYQYKNYSTPVARNDQRITGGMTIKYSLNPKIKLMADIKVDLLASDGYNTQGGNPTPYADPPATYKAGNLGIGIAADL